VSIPMDDEDLLMVHCKGSCVYISYCPCKDAERFIIQRFIAQ
jgi:hypothetical protein